MWVVLNSQSTSWNPVERLLFPAPTASYGITSFPDELILIPREDGEKVPCLFMPFKHARFLIVYFHANAEDLGLCHGFCKIMRELFQVHVLAVEYPGYGVCPGRTDEAGIMANARAALRFATETLNWPCDGIKLFGRSLGTGPALALATQYDVAGVILISPFTSIRNLFRSQVGPLAEFVCDRFLNSQLAARVLSATLIIHGQQDTLVPLDHGRQIYESLCTRKMMVCPAGMGHNTSLLRNIGTFVLPMTQFFSLPDYTFEDIEVPAWAYPTPRARHRWDRALAEGGGDPLDEDADHELAQVTASLGIREDLAGGSRPSPAQGASRGKWAAAAVPALRAASMAPDSEFTEEGLETRSGGGGPSSSDIREDTSASVQVEEEEIVVMAPKLSPRQMVEPAGPAADAGVKVSRRYDFGIRAPGSGDDDDRGGPQDVVLSEIDDRIAWLGLVENKTGSSTLQDRGPLGRPTLAAGVTSAPLTNLLGGGFGRTDGPEGSCGSGRPVPPLNLHRLQ